jgi:exonuclease III
MIRLISWNLAGRGAKVRSQIAALASRRPDILALQEVLPSAEPVLREAFAELGFAHTIVSSRASLAGTRRTCQLTASRQPLVSLQAVDASLSSRPWLLSGRVCVDRFSLEVHNAHIPPGSSNGWLKITALRDIYLTLANKSEVPRILCGDFNTPQAELPNGQVITWAQRLRGSGTWHIAPRIRHGSGKEWDEAERAVLTGLAQFDLEDCFRALHGYGRQEHSGYFRGAGKRIGRRFDHVLASRSLRPQSCEYLHELRISDLSDHSPIEADFDWPSPRG